MKTEDVTKGLFKDDLVVGVGSTPWWSCHRKGHLRSGPEAVSLAGTATILFCVSKSVWVQAYKVTDITTKSVPIDSFEIFFDGNDGSKFLDKSSRLFKLQEGGIWNPTPGQTRSDATSAKRRRTETCFQPTPL